MLKMLYIMRIGLDVLGVNWKFNMQKETERVSYCENGCYFVSCTVQMPVITISC